MNKIQEQLLAEELKRTGGNLSKVARSLGLNYYELLSRHGGRQTFMPALGPEPQNIRDIGRDGFKHYVIAIKRAGYRWPDKFAEVLADARRKFDAGTHEMFQTSDNGWVVQYLIPRKHPVRRRDFFRSAGL